MRISDWSSDVCSSDLMSQSMVQMATMQRDLIYVDEKIRYLLGVADQRGPAMAALDKRLTSVERWNRIVGIAILSCTGVVGWGWQKVDEMYRLDQRVAIDRKSTRLNSSH